MFNVVLVEPEIPPNTGTIGRPCLALGAKLPRVGPLGFEVSDKYLKRAGLDYWEHLDVQIYPEGVESFIQKNLTPDTTKIFFSKNAGRSLYDDEETRFAKGSYLFFGRETYGLPTWILNRYAAETRRIPMLDARVRSLNLSNAVSVVLYEGMRQLGYLSSKPSEIASNCD